eukprot:9451911-Lingulodinium_polyedra.AAC.1
MSDTPWPWIRQANIAGPGVHGSGRGHANSNQDISSKQIGARERRWRPKAAPLVLCRATADRKSAIQVDDM